MQTEWLIRPNTEKFRLSLWCFPLSMMLPRALIYNAVASLSCGDRTCLSNASRTDRFSCRDVCVQCAMHYCSVVHAVKHMYSLSTEVLCCLFGLWLRLIRLSGTRWAMTCAIQTSTLPTLEDGSLSAVFCAAWRRLSSDRTQTAGLRHVAVSDSHWRRFYLASETIAQCGSHFYLRV